VKSHEQQTAVRYNQKIETAELTVHTLPTAYHKLTSTMMLFYLTPVSNISWQKYVSTYGSYMHHPSEKKANTVSVLYSFCKTRCLMFPENIQSLGLLKLSDNDLTSKLSVMCTLMSNSQMILTSRSGFLPTVFSSLSALGATVKHDTGSWDGM
jgi:hypothetical protein